MEIKKQRTIDRIIDEYPVLRCQDGDQLSLSLLIRKWQPAFLRDAIIVTTREIKRLELQVALLVKELHHKTGSKVIN